MRVRQAWKLSEKGRRVWFSKMIVVLKCKRLTPRKSLWFLPSPQAAFIFRPPSWEESTTFRSFLTFARLFPGWQWPSINLSSRWQIWKVRTGLQTGVHFQQFNTIKKRLWIGLCTLLFALWRGTRDIFDRMRLYIEEVLIFSVDCVWLVPKEHLCFLWWASLGEWWEISRIVWDYSRGLGSRSICILMTSIRPAFRSFVYHRENNIGN